MSQELDRRMIRLLHGELPPDEARDLRRSLESDPGAAVRFAELERIWSGLEPAPPPRADEGLLAGVRARVQRGEGAAEGGLWGLSPVWGRAVAAAALASGIGLGVWLGADAAAADEATLLLEPTLAESYWSGFADAAADGGWEEE